MIVLISDHAGDRVASPQPEHLVPHDHLPEINDHRGGKHRPDDRGVPATLLSEDNRRSLLPRLDLGLDLLDGEIGRNAVLRVRRLKPSNFAL
jgi:hypothetical protein